MNDDAAIHINPTAQIAFDAKITAPRVRIGDHVQVLPGAIIEAGKEIRIESGAIVGANVRILAERIGIGYGTKIGNDCHIRAKKGRPSELVSIGDFTFLDCNSNVLARRFQVGDYVSIYKDLYMAGGRRDCLIGHNCWIGQDTILDTNEQLTIGNNVRIGTGSQIWTHVASGELLEGCVLFGRQPVVLEDNVWVVGGAVISPGLVLGNGSIVMVGSVLTKSTEVRHCYAGVPAKDVTDKIKTYQPITMADKWRMMAEFLAKFVEDARTGGYLIQSITHGYTLNKGADRFSVLMPPILDEASLLAVEQDTLVFTTGEARELGNPRVTVFSLLSKRYTKRRSPGERLVITFLGGHMARFIPDLPQEP